MILEHAVLPVKPGMADDFVAAFEQAKKWILAQPGCRSLQVLRSIETPDRFVLLVEWDSVEAHERGFRGSPSYAEWRRLLHRFYEPMPVVEHFTTVIDEAPHRYEG